MRAFIFFAFLSIFTIVCKAEDLVVTREGIEYKGKLILVSEKEIVIKLKNGIFHSGDSNSIPADQVYMIKTDKRGTIFFNRQRERLVIPTKDIGKNADIIYLVDGGEISGWNLGMENGIVTYQKDPKQKRAMSNIGAIPTEEIFMIKYNDGSKDILTDITKEQESNLLIPQSVGEHKLKVIIYNVENGDTLGLVADKFNVDMDSIIEWNDLSSHANRNTKLASGLKLMIQIPVN